MYRLAEPERANKLRNEATSAYRRDAAFVAERNFRFGSDG